jgi:hypothetical protein
MYHGSSHHDGPCRADRGGRRYAAQDRPVSGDQTTDEPAGTVGMFLMRRRHVAEMAER